MKFGNVNNFTRGWIIGDFEPSLFKTKDNDIGILRINRSHVEFLEDTVLLVVKNPSTNNDKHYNLK